MTFFWGGGTLSWLRYMTLASFRHYHPDWDICLCRSDTGLDKLWKTCEIEDVTGYSGVNYFDRLADLNVLDVSWTCPIPGLSTAQISDVFEWHTLANIAGFYSDMDVLYIKPINYDAWCKSDAVFCLSGGYMTIGFMGAGSQSPIFECIYNAAITHYNPANYQSLGAGAIYRLVGLEHLWSRVHAPGQLAIQWLSKKFPLLCVSTMLDKTIYPWTYLELDNIFERNETVPDECTAIHWFGASPIAQVWNNKLTDDNFGSFNTTLTNYAKLVG
jgi:hypothetical protein